MKRPAKQGFLFGAGNDKINEIISYHKITGIVFSVFPE
jgi:hypothetical protein